MKNISQTLGLIGGIGMPFWNIPLMVRIVRRRSAMDISLGWLFGVWGCIVLMAPSALTSPDPILRGFGWSNLILFSVVVVVVLRYRKQLN